MQPTLTSSKTSVSVSPIMSTPLQPDSASYRPIADPTSSYPTATVSAPLPSALSTTCASPVPLTALAIASATASALMDSLSLQTLSLVSPRQLALMDKSSMVFVACAPRVNTLTQSVANAPSATASDRPCKVSRVSVHQYSTPLIMAVRLALPTAPTAPPPTRAPASLVSHPPTGSA